MIETLSSWTKSVVLAVIIVSILEMILPNNKQKKYVKMVMGIFILFNIISPIIKNKDSLSFDEIDVKKIATTSSTGTNAEYENVVVNQESMDRRIEELYIEQFEKDITKKVEKLGFIVKKCKVDAVISQDEDNTGIKKIILKVEKNKNAKQEDILNEASTNDNLDESNNNGNVNISRNTSENSSDDISNDFEDKIVTEIQKIKKVTTGVSNVSSVTQNKQDEGITNQDIRNLKLFLIKEYEVNERCLEIN